MDLLMFACFLLFSGSFATGWVYCCISFENIFESFTSFTKTAKLSWFLNWCDIWGDIWGDI